jgi:membrane protease YdiL (CAAX protease family)
MITIYLSGYGLGDALYTATIMPIAGIVLQHYTMGFEEPVEENYLSKSGFTILVYAFVGIVALGTLGVIGKNLLSVTEQLTIIPAMAFASLYAIGEEALFRGWLYRWLQERTSFAVGAIIISAAVFTVCHTWLFPVTSLYDLTYVFMGGCLLAYLYFATGTLLTPLLVHIMNNILAVI